MAASPASAWASASSASPASASASVSSAVHHGTLPVWHAGVPTTYPSHPVLRLWNSMVIIMIVAVSWIYPYLFGFVNIHEITMAWTIGDGVVCAILFTDQLVLLTTSGKSIWMIFDISSLIPLKLILLLPVSTLIKFILASTCNFSRLIHVRKAFKTLSNWRPGMCRIYDFFLRGTFLIFARCHPVYGVAHGMGHKNGTGDPLWLDRQSIEKNFIGDHLYTIHDNMKEFRREVHYLERKPQSILPKALLISILKAIEPLFLEDFFLI